VIVLSTVFCQQVASKAIGGPVGTGFVPGGFFPGGPVGIPFPGGPGGIPGGPGPFFPGGPIISPGGPVVSPGGPRPPTGGSAGIGDQRADFSVDMDSDIEASISNILRKASNGNQQVQSFSSALRSAPQADISTAERTTGKNFAALRASGGPSGGASVQSASSARICPQGGCYPPPPPTCNYCYNPCWSCPVFRPKLYCSITYSPNWKLCCWFVWWWY
jgi:hypothetical protein